ncbi:MAG: L-lactate permease [Candidatus Thorarchaeota archaeon]
MEAVVGFILIILPIVLALVLLVFMKKAADITGVIVWFVTFIIAIVAFQTDVGIAITASVAGIVKSFPISLMVATSILMMTYMQEVGALQRLIVFFKTLGGGSRPMQILMISFGLGLFLVGIGATPVSMLPPVMLALGFSPMVAVALPSIGYDPLTTFALLGVPAVVFTGEYSAWATESITLQEAGSVFAWFMPLVSIGIAISMLWIAGGRKLLLSRDGVVLASLCGLTAGGMAIVCNVILPLTTLTNVFAGAAVLLVLFIFNKVRGKPILDRSTLEEKDIEVENGMSIYRASIPWVVLVMLSLVTNMIPQIFQLMFVDLAFPVQIGGYPSVIRTRFLWQAYTLMLIATFVSMPFLKTNANVLKRTMVSFLKRAPRPVVAAAIFFAMADVMNFSGWAVDSGGVWLNPTSSPGLDPTNNMIYLLASLTAGIGLLYPLLAPFMGLLGGFISGSETSAIAMFTRYHVETSTIINASAVHVAASNGIGGGLASVLSPAKIQNAAAVIDEIGIEGEVIRYGIVVAVLMTLVTSFLTLLWAFPLSIMTLTVVATISGGVILFGGIVCWFKRPSTD